jgi:anti-sigma factor RsiW
MGEDCVCTHGSGREVEPGGQRITAAAGELDALSRHHSAILRFLGDDERRARVEARWKSMARLSHRAIASSTAPGPPNRALSPVIGYLAEGGGL